MERRRGIQVYLSKVAKVLRNAQTADDGDGGEQTAQGSSWVQAARLIEISSSMLVLNERSASASFNPEVAADMVVRVLAKAHLLHLVRERSCTPTGHTYRSSRAAISCLLMRER